MMDRLAILLFGVLTMVSCTGFLEPEGELVERNMDIPTDITGIEITDGMQLVFNDEIPTGQAVVRTHNNVQPYIKAKIDYGRILFEVDARRFKNLDVTIVTAPIPYNNFTASGGSKMYMRDRHTCQKASFSISGGSKAMFACECETATINCSGGSEIVCEGRCNHVAIDCSGGSYFYGYDFATQVAEVVVSGGSHLEVDVSESLSGENSGGSIIYCKGTSTILNINNHDGSTIVRP